LPHTLEEIIEEKPGLLQRLKRSALGKLFPFVAAGTMMWSSLAYAKNVVLAMDPPPANEFALKGLTGSRVLEIYASTDPNDPTAGIPGVALPQGPLPVRFLWSDVPNNTTNPMVEIKGIPEDKVVYFSAKFTAGDSRVVPDAEVSEFSRRVFDPPEGFPITEFNLNQYQGIQEVAKWLDPSISLSTLTERPDLGFIVSKDPDGIMLRDIPVQPVGKYRLTLPFSHYATDVYKANGVAPPIDVFLNSQKVADNKTYKQLNDMEWIFTGNTVPNHRLSLQYKVDGMPGMYALFTQAKLELIDTGQYNQLPLISTQGSDLYGEAGDLFRLDLRNTHDPDGDDGKIKYDVSLSGPNFNSGSHNAVTSWVLNNPGTYNLLISAIDDLGDMANLGMSFEVEPGANPIFNPNPVDLYASNQSAMLSKIDTTRMSPSDVYFDERGIVGRNGELAFDFAPVSDDSLCSLVLGFADTGGSRVTVKEDDFALIYSSNVKKSVLNYIEIPLPHDTGPDYDIQIESVDGSEVAIDYIGMQCTPISQAQTTVLDAQVGSHMEDDMVVGIWDHYDGFDNELGFYKDWGYVGKKGLLLQGQHVDPTKEYEVIFKFTDQVLNRDAYHSAKIVPNVNNAINLSTAKYPWELQNKPLYIGHLPEGFAQIKLTNTLTSGWEQNGQYTAIDQIILRPVQ